MSQITLRQIPPALDRQLRSISKKNRTSLNKTIMLLLMKALGLSTESPKKRDLQSLSGTWDKNQRDEFIINTEVFNQIDHELWKE